MRKVITAGLAALTLAGAAAATATPAAAQGWYGGGYHHHGGWGAGAAVGAGILGLAVGATLASSHPYYGSGGYYAPGYYGAGYGGGYYAPPPPRPYGGYGYGYGYEEVCRTRVHWNPYWGGYERVRTCD